MEEGKVKLATLAALFHDIGKFYQRAQKNPKDHKHAEFSVKFFEDNKEKLKAVFNLEEEEFSLIRDAVLRHHDRGLEKDEENPLPFVVQKADWLSSGLDRAFIDEEAFFEGKSPEEDKALYKTLVPPFALIDVKSAKATSSDYVEFGRWGYRFRELSVESVFPLAISDLNNYSLEDRKRDYRELWEGFVEAFGKLPEAGDFNFRFESLRALLIKYTWSIPSYTYIKDSSKVPLPDISLAHHLLTTAAIATALWRYGEEEGWGSLKDKEKEKFIFLSVDFSGIQNFIFSPPKDTKKWAAKILRARSFVISLAIEGVVREILNEFGVNASSVIMNSGGKAWLILPNLSDAEERIERVRRRVVKELLSRERNFFGEVKLKVSWIKLKEEDFNLGKFEKALERLAQEEARNRFRLFTTEDFENLIIEGYAQQFSDPKKDICSICGKAPGEEEEGVYKCKLCKRLIEIGTELPKSWGALITYQSPLFPLPDVKPLKDKKLEEILDKMGEGQTIYAFTFNSKIPLPVKPLENFIPEFGSEVDGALRDLILECYRDEGEEVDVRKLQHIPKNFCHIALDSLERRGDSLCGRPYLGVLKADVDNLGYIFSKGFIKLKRDSGEISILSLSRAVSLSWFLDFFFSEVLKSFIKDDKREFGGKFRNIYSVFSGGDDLFLIGPWNKVLEFEPVLREKFEKYTCENNSFTISAGIAVVKPDLPIYFMAEEAEKALDAAKNGGKNATTLFSKKIKYPDFSLQNLLKVADWLTGEIGGWCDEESSEKKGGGSLLYKLLAISEMANREGEDPRNLLWRAYLKYLVYRNFKQGEEGERRAKYLFEKLEELVRNYSEDISENRESKEKDNLFYIPLAIAIYRRRRYGKAD